MEAVLWYVLSGTRGGRNRVRILRALDDQPRNANQLASDLDLNYNTVRHHLEVLVENDVVDCSGDEYGAVYLTADPLDDHWNVVEQIVDQADGLDPQ